MAWHYKKVSEQYGCAFLDTSGIIQSSRLDGLHIDPEDHAKLAASLANLVKDMAAK